MKRFMSILVMIGLVAPNVVLADQGVVVERTPGYWFSYAEKLPIGSTVRVRTTDGQRQTAVLALVDHDGITIELRSRIPEPARRIRYDEIQQLELKTNGPSMVKAAAIGAAIGAGAFVGLLALLAANWD